jgi:hypothetical protein
MPASHMRDIRGDNLRPGDIVAYIMPDIKGLVIGRVLLMHMNSVNIQRLQPEPAPDAFPDLLYRDDNNQMVRVDRPA